MTALAYCFICNFFLLPYGDMRILEIDLRLQVQDNEDDKTTQVVIPKFVTNWI